MDSAYKKKTVLFVSLILLLLLSVGIISFMWGLFSNAGKVFDLVSSNTPPYKQLGSLWISEDPKISMHISDYTSEIERATSFLEKDGNRIDVDIYLEPGRIVIISKKGFASGGRLIVGHITNWNNDEVIIAVDTDNLFDEQYATITLRRIFPG